MTLQEYETLVARTTPDLDPKTRIIYNALKLSGEVGEVCDHVGKTLGQGHELDTTTLLEEAGDIFWHLADFVYALGYTLDECAEGNIHKLRERYPNGFDPERSRARYE